MGKISILVTGGSWVTNIGNAFLDIGSIQSIKQAVPNAEVYLYSVINRWTFYKIDGFMQKILIKKNVKENMFDMYKYINVDFVVQQGAFLGIDWFDVHGEILLSMVKKGAKFIINGGGMTDETYGDKKKIEKTRKYLEKLKPYVFISRDEETYEAFKDIAEYSYNGIDCAFFINDAYIPPSLKIEPYIVLNFDKSPEPSLEELSIDNKMKIVRVHHSPWYNFKMLKYYYFSKNVLFSDVPYDYLTIYANAYATYSDRVHACVVTLTYGNKARLFNTTPRSGIFERLGITNITKELIKIKKEKLEEEKRKQIAFLKKILNR